MSAVAAVEAFDCPMCERGVAVPEIAAKLVILMGKNKGRHPWLAGVYRVPAEEAGPGVGT
ncbi:hypothetical protein [Streptosporangium roseum]|uniref:hypothetical protein n=1 Tax=Streptosporangium roseum TaxID=2001 RepID=UPI003320A888